jgi:AcrR family transcriptional regulator
MAKARAGYHHGDLRNALIVAAVRLIEARGLDAFSLREAAREVGVSANAAYRHFDDKAALVMAVAANGFDRLAVSMLRAMEGAITGHTAMSEVEEAASVARFKAVGRAYVTFAAEHPAIFRVMFSECGPRSPGPGPGPGESSLSSPWALLGASLDALVNEGILDPRRRPGAELKAWAVVHGFSVLAHDGAALVPAGPERLAALEALLDFAVVGICGGSPPQMANR